MKLSDVIKQFRMDNGLSQRQMGAQCGLSTGYISLIEKEVNPQTGKTMVPSLPVMNKLAIGMGLTLDELLSMCDDMDVSLNEKDTIMPPPPPSNIIPMPEMRKVPLIGSIACGTPILAQENLDGEVDIPAEIHADFALRCKGDSMINARIYDGDIVYIRQQEEVEHGEIAAVLVGENATLKRVYLYDDHISLEAENPQYRPMVYWGEDMNSVRILGKAVAFTSAVR